MRPHLPNRALAVSVDVDSLRLYRAIHGLPPAVDDAGPDPAWTRGVTRFAELFEELGIRATFFVVGEDLEHPEVREIARDLLARGHELANHSDTHPYDLVRRPVEQQRAELRRADERLRELTGAPVVGYRAPGYNQSCAVRDTLVELGYRYDASAFPCPPYVLAKTAIIVAKRLRGRRSRSIVTRPFDAFGPRTPRWLQGSGGTVLSLPISVLPGIRFPLIGTSLTLLGTAGVGRIHRIVERMGYLSVEMHALDLLGLDEDGLDGELAAQPDLKVSVERKRATFREFFFAAAATRPSFTHADLARAADTR